MHELHIHVEGRVQGVGFRAFVQKHAAAMRICGIARNMPDGSVFVIAQGTEANLRRLLALVRTGPRLAHVDTVTEVWVQPEQKYTLFSIR